MNVFGRNKRTVKLQHCPQPVTSPAYLCTQDSIYSEYKGHHFPSQPGFPPGSSEHGQFSSSTAVHEPFAVTQAQHHTSYGPAASVPISFAGTTQIRGASPFQSMPFLPQGYAVHSHFTTQPGFIPSASISLQKQLEHANQRSGFTDSMVVAG
ncbi:G protein pathway suppressor 2-like [Sinocyclocheilus anshuiensis]|uniref:G protein pathway suppressor 2-like n=1 Tax=Sinocyclocheilus anshuiensis TaxID=1608454 RepID=UPI0007BA0B4F|nr:PREDICTED: G protein pathway suppressor 2-like [Sinocyclocheilus anshuiensis]